MKETEYLGQVTWEIAKSDLIKTLKQLKSEGYRVLMDLTAVDYIDPEVRTKVVYWLHNPDNLKRIRVVLYLKREEKLPSVTDLWEGADWFERELYDLFGILIENHPEIKRILMPDDWIGHPLRKDYPLGDESVQFKYGVEPKAPSEIIPFIGRNAKRSN